MAAFRDQVAVITGAGREVGRVHALRLARDGAAVVLVDIARNAGRPIEYSLADEEGCPLPPARTTLNALAPGALRNPQRDRGRGRTLADPWLCRLRC